MSTAAETGAAVLLRNPGFIGLLSYRLLAMLSYQIVAVTVGWHIYEITRDPLALGVGSSRVDLQACKLEYSIVSPK